MRSATWKVFKRKSVPSNLLIKSQGDRTKDNCEVWQTKRLRTTGLDQSVGTCRLFQLNSNISN